MAFENGFNIHNNHNFIINIIYANKKNRKKAKFHVYIRIRHRPNPML